MQIIRTSSFSSNNVTDLQREINKDLADIATWLLANKLTLNILKSEYMLVGSRQGIAILEGEFSLPKNNVSLSKVKKSKCLRLQIDEHLRQEAPRESVAKKVVCSLAMLKMLESA